jgi:hypothetical protein
MRFAILYFIKQELQTEFGIVFLLIKAIRIRKDSNKRRINYGFFMGILGVDLGLIIGLNWV